MKWFFFICSLLSLIACQTTQKTTLKSSPAEKFDADYYVGLEKNIRRLHALSLGTFVAHTDPTNQSNQVWNVTGKDSVILYSRPIGDIGKNGYWILSYEFMTSLPNTPIYTSIKKIEQIERDSFRVLYYEYPNELTLSQVLDDTYLEENIILDQLQPRDKKTLFVRQTAAHFIGKSAIYVDKEAGCLRQNIYELTPKHYDVSFSFFDIETKRPLDKKKRPNLMIRRNISQKTLKKMAAAKDS